MSKVHLDTQIRTCIQPKSAMKCISEALRFQYLWLVTGTVPADKWSGVEAKFCARYPTLPRNRGFVHRERKAGKAGHRLIAFTPANDTRTTFYLMGSAPDDDEKWVNGTLPRTRPALWSYEAVRTTKEGQAKTSWTWRLKSDAYNAMREKLIEVIRGADAEQRVARLTTMIAEAKKWPGYHGVRHQHEALGKLLKDEWRRSRGAEPCPEWPKLRYVRFETLR